MNREQRRAFKRDVDRMLKMRKKQLQSVIDQRREAAGIVHTINDGDMVTINTERIVTRKDYANLSDAYKRFVDENKGRVFTARVHRRSKDGDAVLVELEESPEWLFWIGDLQIVKDGG